VVIVAAFVGLDGIRDGWVAVYLGGGADQRFAYGGSVTDLLAAPFDRAMIDMPIGLPERGYRQCDVEARKLVGARVFLGARRGIWNFKTLDEANTYYWKKEGAGRGVSMQLFCLRKKLQELNACSLPPRLLEAHPELIFWRIAGRVLASKRTAEGRADRIRLLEANGIGEVRHWLDQRHGTGIGSDDLIDACACAVAARDSTRRLPATNTAEVGEIWY
jgi:predicted RNase H-like nuclease